MSVHALDALRSPAFRRLWLSRWLWETARVIQITVVPWLMLELTDSPAQVSLVGVVRMAPMFLLGLVGGSLADRFSTVRVMLAAHTLGSAISLLITLAVRAGMASPALLLVASLVAGVSGAIDFPTNGTYLARNFSGPRLMSSLALDTVAFQGSNIFGPLVGGIVLTAAGYTTAFAVASLIHMADLVLVLALPGDVASAHPDARSPAGQSLLQVTRQLWASPAIRMVILTTVLLNLCAFPCIELLPVIARDVLGVGSSLYGALRAARGTGSLVGALALASLAVQRKMELFIMGTIAIMLGFLGLGASSYYALSLAVLILSGLGGASFGTMQSTIVLTNVTADLRGRAMGTVALAIGTAPLGTLMAGYLAETIGAQRAIFTLSISGLLVFGLLSRWAWKLRTETS